MNNQATAERGHRMTNNIRSSAEDVSESFRSVGKAVSDVTQQAMSAGEDFISQARKSGKQGMDQVGSYVKNEPMKALLLSAGAGLLIGLLLRRS